MKIEKILDTLNSFEKNAFLKIIDGIIANKPKKSIEIEKILGDKSSDKSKELKKYLYLGSNLDYYNKAWNIWGQTLIIIIKLDNSKRLYRF